MILITGASGFLGRHTMAVLRARYGADAVIGVSSADADLMQFDQVTALLDRVKPDVVLHFAAYSGGIGANRTYPADFYFRNTILTANMFEACARRGIGKIIYPMGGCSYPAKATSPISEDQLWCGYPQPESAPYSTAKMMGTVAAKSYRFQHGVKATVVIPGNMYGEYDNFHPLDSHVVPAMVRRYYEAQLNGLDEVVMWGTGTPQRDFVYAADVAALMPFFIDNDIGEGPINLSSGTRTPIKELAETIAKLVKFEGRITWDTEKPDGQMVKIFATDRMAGLGLSCPTSLEAGLRNTIDWFAANYATRGDGLRL